MTGAVPLHSAPSRVPPAATAVIRAELRDAESGGPAAWAVVEASVGGTRIGRGMADARGRLLLLAHYPEPTPPPLGAAAGSPPSGPTVPLYEQTWPVRLDVYASARPLGDPPDLCDALLQPPAIAWEDAAQRAALGEVDLRYGEELQVRTSGGADGALLVTRTDGSPP
jgi:hypothetical protein